MINKESYPRCKTCGNFTRSDLAKDMDHYDGHCVRLKQNPHQGFEVKESFGCILHTALKTDE